MDFPLIFHYLESDQKMLEIKAYQPGEVKNFFCLVSYPSPEITIICLAQHVKDHLCPLQFKMRESNSLPQER